MKAEVVKLNAPFWKYQRMDRAVQLYSANINEIRIVVAGGASPGSTSYTFHTHFRVLLDIPLPAATKRAVVAKSKVIKQNKLLGIFGGKIAYIRWVGGSMADNLNQDNELQKVLLVWAEEKRLPKIRIKPMGKSEVTIIAHATTMGEDAFDVYDRIAKYVRELASAY